MTTGRCNGAARHRTDQGPETKGLHGVLGVAGRLQRADHQVEAVLAGSSLALVDAQFEPGRDLLVGLSDELVGEVQAKDPQLSSRLRVLAKLHDLFPGHLGDIDDRQPGQDSRHLCAGAGDLLAEFPNVRAWFARVKAIGHGTSVDMTPKEALAVAKAATSDAKEAADPHDPSGRKPGDRVVAAAEDYGRDPIAGTLVFANAHEIAIRREEPEVGEVVVHVPRAGFRVSAG